MIGMGLSGRGTNRTQNSQGKKELSSSEDSQAASTVGQTLEEEVRLRVEPISGGQPLKHSQHQHNWGQGVESMKQELIA